MACGCEEIAPDAAFETCESAGSGVDSSQGSTAKEVREMRTAPAWTREETCLMHHFLHWRIRYLLVLFASFGGWSPGSCMPRTEQTVGAS